MIDTDKYEGHDLAKGRVGSDYNIYDRKGNIIFDADDVGSNMATLNLLADAPLLLEEVKRLRIIENAAQLYGDYCKERHGQSDDCVMSFEEWLDWMLTDDILEKMMIHYDKEALDDMKSKATGTGWLLDGCLTDYSKLKGLVE